MSEKMSDEMEKIDVREVIHEAVTGVKTHTSDGESVSDYSMSEKIEGLRELDRRDVAKNPLSAVGRFRTRMNSMQE